MNFTSHNQPSFGPLAGPAPAPVQYPRLAVPEPAQPTPSAGIVPSVWTGAEPLVAVAEDKFIKGRNTPTEQTPMAMVLPLREALEKSWGTDAHFHTYLGAATNSEQYFDLRQFGFPRVNKTALAHTRAHGMEILHPIIALDYDNHEAGSTEKAPWTDESLAAFACDFQNALQQPYLAAWAPHFFAFYTTRNGCRLIYALDRPVTSEVWEKKVAGILEAFSRVNLPFDFACKDSTRFFRLPRVMRDGKMTEPEVLEIQGTYASTASIPEGISDFTETARRLTVRPTSGKRPTPAECQKILTVLGESGRLVATTFKTAAKKALKQHPETYGVCFEDAPSAAVGGRDNAILKHVGVLCTVLSRLPGNMGTAEGCYALLEGAVDELEPDADTPDWLEKCWGRVMHFWGIEEHRAAAELKSLLEINKESATIEGGLIAGVRSWHPDAAVDMKWVRDHGICVVGPNYFPLMPNGHYASVNAPSLGMVPSIFKENGLAQILTYRKLNKEGIPTLKTSAELLEATAFSVRSVVAYPQQQGGWIENYGKESARLVINSYRRNPHLEPTYSKEVDEWLMHLAGSEKNYKDICRWLGFAVAFEDGPICGLSLMGAGGSGKGLLVAGLAETLETPASGNKDDLVGGYAYGLLRSPYIFVDENFPHASGQINHPADAFRRLVSGDATMANTKFNAPVEIFANCRVIMAANGMDCVKALCAGRNLSTFDREALEERIMHLEVGDGGAKYFRSRGGRKFTSGWVQGGQKEKNNFTLAKHFLWLHSQRDPEATDGRFLVRGNEHPALRFLMQTQSGKTGIVISAICAMLENEKVTRRNGFVVVENQLFVLPAEISKYINVAMREQTGDRIAPQQVEEVLKGLAEQAAAPFQLTGTEGVWVWHRIDLDLIQRAAVQTGHPMTRLNEILTARKP